MVRIMHVETAAMLRARGWAVGAARSYATWGSGPNWRTISLRRKGKRRLWGWSARSCGMDGFETALAAYIAGELQGWKPLDAAG